MSTDTLRACADSMDEDGVVPRTWMLVMKDENGDTLVFAPVGQAFDVAMLAEAQEMARNASGAAKTTQ